ncbi:MAG: hypothetical protein JNL67_11455 [Planctomycetaceae bacterium]|nr:hypothetical protein [Planctomycetaceae bacterium]
MNVILWLLGSLAIGLGLGFQWLFWSGSDLPELSRFGRGTTFIRRTFANTLIVVVGLVLFAIPAAQDQRWQLVALSAIVALLMVVLVLAMWDWVAINIAVRRGRDAMLHDQLKSELLEIQAAAQRRKEENRTKSP